MPHIVNHDIHKISGPPPQKCTELFLQVSRCNMTTTAKSLTAKYVRLSDVSGPERQVITVEHQICTSGRWRSMLLQWSVTYLHQWVWHLDRSVYCWCAVEVLLQVRDQWSSQTPSLHSPVKATKRTLYNKNQTAMHQVTQYYHRLQAQRNWWLRAPKQTKW